MAYYYGHGINVEIDYMKSYLIYQNLAKKIKQKVFKTDIPIRYKLIKFSVCNDLAKERALSRDIDAALYVGCLYQHGFEIQKSEKTALYWYKIAASQGSREAVKQIEIIKGEV